MRLDLAHLNRALACAPTCGHTHIYKRIYIGFSGRPLTFRHSGRPLALRHSGRPLTLRHSGRPPTLRHSGRPLTLQFCAAPQHQHAATYLASGQLLPFANGTLPVIPKELRLCAIYQHSLFTVVVYITVFVHANRATVSSDPCCNRCKVFSTAFCGPEAP